MHYQGLFLIVYCDRRCQVSFSYCMLLKSITLLPIFVTFSLKLRSSMSPRGSETLNVATRRFQKRLTRREKRCRAYVFWPEEKLCKQPSYFEKNKFWIVLLYLADDEIDVRWSSFDRRLVVFVLYFNTRGHHFEVTRFQHEMVTSLNNFYTECK